jgi:hypothetical protein
VPKLNYRQILFVAEYMVDGHAGPAAIRAGYSPKSSVQQGVALLKNPSVAESIREKTAEKVARIAEREELTDARLADEGRVTVPWVRGLLYSTAERCQAEDAYMPAQVLRAAELAGKHLSMFVDRVDVTANVTFNINLTGAGGHLEHQAGGIIDVEEGEGDGDQGAGDGGPVRELRFGAGPGGQAEGLGEGAGGEDRSRSEHPETIPEGEEP